MNLSITELAYHFVLGMPIICVLYHLFLSYIAIIFSPVLFHSLFHFTFSFFFFSQSFYLAILFRIIFVWIAIWLLYLSISFLRFTGSCFIFPCLKKVFFELWGLSFTLLFYRSDCLVLFYFFIDNNIPFLVTLSTSWQYCSDEHSLPVINFSYFFLLFG